LRCPRLAAFGIFEHAIREAESRMPIKSLDQAADSWKRYVTVREEVTGRLERICGARG